VILRLFKFTDEETQPYAKGTQCLPTSPEGPSGEYLVPTASLPWDLSGTRRVSESGKQRKRIGRVVGRCDISESESRVEG
jgi:hypothetical protein